MDKSFSALFAGLCFDKKRFTTDVARFEPKVKEEKRKENEESEQQVAAVTGTKMEKKRKRKMKEKVLDIMDGFSLFKSPDSLLVRGKAGKSEDMEDDSSEQRKEAEKQIEQAALLRKKYGLHISGANVPSPLQSFA